MKELDGELSWENIEENNYDYEDGEDSSESSFPMSEESPESCSETEYEDSDQEVQEDSEFQDLFSARRATKLLLSKYPDAFSYDPKSMRLVQFML